MAKQKPVSLITFQNHFNTEEACHEHLFNMKWPNGYKCPKCGNNQVYITKTRKHPLYECNDCRHQTTVLVSTIFEKTRTDLRKWFWAIYLVAHDKRGVSANSLSEKIEVCYQTAWLMLHKIRNAMGERDTDYLLSGIVELDDSFFGTPTQGGKRGRGTEKAKVVIGVSLSNKGNPQYIKMEVVSDLKGTTLVDFAQRNIKEGSTISSDMYRSYNALAKENYQHNAKRFAPKENPDHLNWLHTIVSNVKALIGGTFHGLDSKHLQTYLNEISYRFNRRKFKNELFNRVLNCCALTKTITYSELTR